MHRRVLERHHVDLAVLALDAVLAVVVKEGVETRAVDEDVLGVNSPDTPRSLAGRVARVGARLLKVRVGIGGVDGEGLGRVGVALEVRGLGLDEGEPDVGGVVELVVLEDRVLRGGGPAPDGSFSLDEDTAAVEDINLTVLGLGLERVVGNPIPRVLEVGATTGRDVEHHERTKALLGNGVGDVGVLCTLLQFKLGAAVPTDAGVDIPEAGSARRSTLDVPLHDDGAGLGTSSAEDEIRHLNVANITGLANLEDGLGVGLVLEELVTSSKDQRPNLASDFDVLGDLDSLGDDVGTMVKVDNLIRSNAVKDLLDGVGVVRLAIALGTLGLDADKVANRDVLVLRLGAGEDLASGLVEQRGRLPDVLLGALYSTAGSSSADSSAVGLALDEKVHLLVALENHRLGGIVQNSLLRTREVNVVQNEGAIGLGRIGVVGSLDTGGGVGKNAVNHQDRPDSLTLRPTVGHVNTDLAVVDVNVLESPSPVPVHVDGSLAAVEGEVAGSELLIAKEGTILATIESKINHETAGAVVHEDTQLLVRGTTVLTHVEDNIVQTGGLGDLPVDAGTLVEWHVLDVDDKVANLAEEVVLVGPPVAAVILVGISVNHGHAFKVGGGLESRRVDGITDHLGVVVGNDRLADAVGAGREVHKTGSRGLRGAAETTAVLVADGPVDGLGIIGGAIALGTVVLNIAEDLVVGRVGVEGSITLPLDGTEPPARFLARGWGRNGR